MNQLVAAFNDVTLNKNSDLAARETLGRIGNLEVRLAANTSEIEAALRLRKKVFFDECGAKLLKKNALIDHDYFDDYCDHLIVLDREIIGSEASKIVGTYRLMQKHHAARAGGYYSAAEFAVAGLIARHPNRRFLELGRSCVLPRYRAKRTIEVLWQGIWAYCLQNEIDVMMGCASFSGVIPAKHAQALSFLNSHARATHEWHIAPLAGRYVSMDLVPAEAINLKSALAELPPLIKGYLRLGAIFGDGAVIDHDFNSIDVMVVLPREKITQRYRSHFGENAERFAA
ncbi:MAG: GNAT family N-acetyltransferase [Ahrensia sp.]|nr:GNAT family N-acetyltransferase [Ahrensia sp.]